MFKIPEELTISHVESCKASLLEFIDKNDEIVFDDSQVSRIDTIGIQLLLNIIIYISAQKKTLIWQVNSQIIKQSINQLGINEPILNQYINE